MSNSFWTNHEHACCTVHVPIVSNGMAYVQPPYDHATHLGVWDACYLLSSY
jgi:hypothetical protein